MARNCVFWRNLEICSFRAKSNRTLIFLYPCLYFWSIFRKSGGFLKIWSFCKKRQKQFWPLPVLVCFGAKLCFVDEILKFVVSGGFMKIWSVLQKIEKKQNFRTLPVLECFGAKFCFLFDEILKFVVFVQNQTEPWFSLTPAYTFGICLRNQEFFA